jgi:hypothetical protein
LHVLQVARLRAERKTFTPDPRFTHVVELVRSGYFGWEDYFGPIMDAITTGMTRLLLRCCCPVQPGLHCHCARLVHAQSACISEACSAHIHEDWLGRGFGCVKRCADVCF